MRSKDLFQPSSSGGYRLVQNGFHHLLPLLLGGEGIRQQAGVIEVEVARRLGARVTQHAVSLQDGLSLAVSLIVQLGEGRRQEGQRSKEEYGSAFHNSRNRVNLFPAVKD